MLQTKFIKVCSWVWRLQITQEILLKLVNTLNYNPIKFLTKTSSIMAWKNFVREGIDRKISEVAYDKPDLYGLGSF